MINVEFLKKLTILYVEDEDVAREKLAKTLNRLFKKVYLAPNGLEGYIQFQKLHLAKTPVDLVLSDINMPKMSGIEMLAQIRELDKEVPFIFTTARSESENLLKAIELKANHYILKPIDMEDVVLKSQEVCQKKYYERMLLLKNQELEQYLKALNNVAVVLKFDEEGNITFINSSFLESFDKNEDEILNTSFRELIHTDISKEVIDSLFEIINKNKIWEGDLKYLSSDNNPFYVNSTIFEIEENNKKLFINIGFVSTKENLEKREFKKKVLKNIQEQNQKILIYKKEVEELRLKISKYENIIVLLKEEIENEKKKNQTRLNQLKHLETEKLTFDEKQEHILKAKNKQFEDYRVMLAKVKKEKEALLEKTHVLEKELLERKLDIERKEEMLELKRKRIEDLNDVVKYREIQLKKLDPSIILN
ncbi:response regulator [Malaciobacter mytili]|uniref:response regulator n=1 Tax=Malaciobacter mytili TaxID=603050 RepID=UPI003A840803